jgi:hypothetical protein
MEVAWLGIQEDGVKRLPSHVFLLDDNLPEAFWHKYLNNQNLTLFI